MRLIGRSLGHRFSPRPPLFSDIGFTWDGGDLVALCGPSGSGKSTLLSLLAGWITPTEGELQWSDIDNVTWVAQNPYGMAKRTVIDHAVLPLIAQGRSRAHAEARAGAVLATFGLESALRTPFGQVSGGEAQRLMLARAVLSEANLVLVDEPTAQLDACNASTVIDALRALADPTRIVVVATHDDRVVSRCTTSLTLGA